MDARDFLDDDWRDAIDANDPDYPKVPDWLETVKRTREEQSDGE